MVEQIPAAVAHPALGDAVLPRTAEAGLLGLDAKARYGIDHVIVELRAAIKDQIAGGRVVRERLAQLLNNPPAGRMSGHIAMKKTPPVMRDHEEAIENAEGERRHREEIHRGNDFAMIAQKRRPSFCRLMISRSFPHPTQHRSLRNVDAKHFQFPMNARRTPGRVLGDHAEDELTQFPADTLSSRADSMPRKPRPRQLEPCPVPANNCLRLDQDQHPLPSPPEPPQDHPKQFVMSGNPRLRMLLFQNCELLA